MAPRADKSLSLNNITNQGLAFRDKDNKIVFVAKAELRLSGKAISSKYGICGDVFSVHYNDCPKVFKVLIPKNALLNPLEFEKFCDLQTGRDLQYKTRYVSLWKTFYQKEEECYSMKEEKKFTVCEQTGLLYQVCNIGDRNTERYVFNQDLILDFEGKKMVGRKQDVIFYPTLSSKSKDTVQILKPISCELGGRDVMNEILSVSTPDNIEACVSGIASAIGLFHSEVLRDVTGGQVSTVLLKSKDGGKSEGKTGVQQLGAKTCSCWQTHRISTLTSIQTLRKKASFTTLPLFLDDVNNDRRVAELTVGYDGGETYETKDGCYRQCAGFIISLNYIG